MSKSFEEILINGNEEELNNYDIYDLDNLKELYNESCSLRFISNWKLTKRYVKQFEENVIITIEKAKLLTWNGMVFQTGLMIILPQAVVQFLQQNST